MWNDLILRTLDVHLYNNKVLRLCSVKQPTAKINARPVVLLLLVRQVSYLRRKAHATRALSKMDHASTGPHYCLDIFHFWMFFCICLLEFGISFKCHHLERVTFWIGLHEALNTALILPCTKVNIQTPLMACQVQI